MDPLVSLGLVELVVLFLEYVESLVLSDYLDLVDLVVSLDLVVQLYLVHLVRFRMVYPLQELVVLHLVVL